MPATDGGYNAAYETVPCLWGTSAGSLVRSYLTRRDVKGKRVLDLGAGEGKNAAALAAAGARVRAIECSTAAITNGKRAFPAHGIEWILEDVADVDLQPASYDLVVSYGLYHCLESEAAVLSLITETQAALRSGGGLHSSLLQ